jgi:hypothetical protein
MKKIFLISILLITSQAGFCCKMCEKQQPKILQGIVHGGVPDSQWDYLIVWGVVIITALTLFFAVKWIIKPGEKDKNHIKYSMLHFE